MLTSAGGILALLQDNPQVKDGSKTEDVQLKVGNIYCQHSMELPVVRRTLLIIIDQHFLTTPSQLLLRLHGKQQQHC